MVLSSPVAQQKPVSRKSPHASSNKGNPMAIGLMMESGKR